MDADAAAGQLYRVPPGEFVAARDDAVAHARDAGDTAAARAIAAFRRPTRAAWLTNLLVGAAPDEVEGLLALAGPLADAQRSLDGTALRQVSAQRTKLVGALARRAAQLGREAGQQVDSGLEREVRGVLESALADDDLAAQVRSGRLVRFERHSGFGTFGADDGAGPASGRGSGSPRARRTAPPDKAPGTDSDPGAEAGTDADTGELGRKRREVDRRTREQLRAERQEREHEAAERREHERREQALADAQDRLEQARLAANDATRERDDARERADGAAEHRDEAHRRVDDRRAELDRARAEATAADRALTSAEREAGDAARRARRADAEVSRAEQDLDAARDT